jgi:hypothetical protein
LKTNFKILNSGKSGFYSFSPEDSGRVGFFVGSLRMRAFDRGFPESLLHTEASHLRLLTEVIFALT